MVECCVAAIGDGDAVAALGERLGEPDDGALGAAQRPLQRAQPVEAYSVIGQHDLRHHRVSPVTLPVSSKDWAAAAARATGSVSIIWLRKPESRFSIVQCSG